MWESALTKVVLLKTNGTLWRWGERAHSWLAWPVAWQGLRNCTPRQLGTSTDWVQLLRMGGTVTAQKTDGSVWNLANDKLHHEQMVLNTNLALAGLTGQRLQQRPLTTYWDNTGAGIRPDGSLWVWGRLHWGRGHPDDQCEVMPVSRGTN